VNRQGAKTPKNEGRNAPHTRVKLAKMVLDVATSTPAEAARFVRAEFERWARVIKEAGVQLQQ
jgi:tripartite-type tricarboxylate transporter receptor subunit TctC